MENQKIIEHIVRGLEYYMDTLAAPPHMEKHIEQDCSWIKPKDGVQFGPEGVYNINFEGKTDEEIQRVVRQYREQGAPDFWMVTPLSLPRHLGDILRGMGLTVLPKNAMAILPEKTFDSGWAEIKRSSRVPVKKIVNKDDFNIWADIINKALFGSPLIDPDLYYPLCAGGTMVCFLGYDGDVPAATAMTLVTSGKVGRLEWVATLPEHRRKGIGAAVCCAGIEQLINGGASIITLCASEMAVSLYTSLGFAVYF